MRSAEQITRTPTEYREHRARERSLIYRDLMRLLDEAFQRKEEWYMWILNGRPTLSEDEYERVRRR